VPEVRDGVESVLVEEMWKSLTSELMTNWDMDLERRSNLLDTWLGYAFNYKFKLFYNFTTNLCLNTIAVVAQSQGILDENIVRDRAVDTSEVEVYLQSDFHFHYYKRLTFRKKIFAINREEVMFSINIMF
jgi:hypothetical protein